MRSRILVALVVLIAALLVPQATLLAGDSKNPHFVGDRGVSTGTGASLDRSVGAAKTGSNNGGHQSLAGLAGLNNAPLANDPKRPFMEGNIRLKDGTKPYSLSADAFAKANKARGNTEMYRTPPRNVVVVIDTQKWNNLTPAQQAQMTQTQTVTKVRTFTVTQPVFQNVSRILYPCCCHHTFTERVGTVTQQQQQTVTCQETVGADYPIAQADVERDLFTSKGLPIYRTQLPSTFTGSDGKKYPFVPIATDANDQIVAAGGSTSSINEGIAPTESGSPASNIHQRFWPDGHYEDVPVGGQTDTTYTGTTVTRAPVKTKHPLAGADPSKGLTVGRVHDSTSDQGINSFSGDVADVINANAKRNSDGSISQ